MASTFGFQPDRPSSNLGRVKLKERLIKMKYDWTDKMFNFFAVIGFGVFLAFVALVLTGLAALGLTFIRDFMA